ncbi:MAG: extracellular solute-binding protein [Eubacteriales bacterium]|nr:extracellular solute-binding protein [Eubacteriales bacterium]
MKKIIALVLALLTISVLFASCGNETPETSESSSKAQESNTENSESTAETTSEVSSDDEEKLLLPDIYWGTTLKMLVNKNRYYEEYEFWWDEVLDDVVVTAVVDRTRLINEKYGINIEVQYVNSLGATIAEVEKAINGGLELDLIADGAYSIAPATLNGWFYDLREENSAVNNGEGYIQFEASWWDQTAIRDLSIGNKLYFLTGDICVSDDEATWTMYFNKDLIDYFHLEDPYMLVNNNEWTLEKMYTMAKQVTLKHGDTMSYNPEDGDRWGIVSQAYDGLMFMLGCQQTMVSKNNEDFPELRIMDQANVNAWSAIFDILTDKENVGVADFFGAWDSGVYGQEVQIFANGNALFMPNGVSSMSSAPLNESDVNFGIIPMPKYDENQENYSSSSTVYWLKVVAIPLSNYDNLECTLFALEALAYYGQTLVTPAYYEKVLKGQKLKDENSEKMLDLIFRNRTYDMSTVYNFGTGNSIMMQFYSSLLGRKTENVISSFYDQMESTYQSAIDKAIEAFQN